MVSASRVFLSYARKDGEQFATALRLRLAAEEPEITLWQDRARMEGGVGWWAQIEDALDQVKFLVIIMTPAAIVSEITRREWRYARQRGVVVYPIKGVSDEQLDYAALPNWMRKAHFFDIGQYIGDRWRDSKEWETFVNYLKSDRMPIRVPFMVPDLPHGFVPRHRELEQLVHVMVDPLVREDTVAITTGLQGSGGYGKTTLAIALCHDERLIEAFDDGVLWTSLGQAPDLVNELGKLYEALTGEHPTFVDVNHASARLAEKLEHRNCLLVVDDVWEHAHLQPFLKGGRRCGRLVTTRRFDLLSGTARVRVDEMSTAESICVLRMPFSQQSVSDVRLERLAKRLGEWPLLLTLVAGMIQKRLDRGDSADGALAHVERALDKRGVTAFDQREPAGRNEAVRRTVAASLDQLSTDDRRRFQRLAVFPEETAIPLTTLERLWGLDDVDTADCAHRLDDVALVSMDLRHGIVRLHDVMRAYLLEEVGDVARVHAELVTSYVDFQLLPDQYAWRWLPYHLLRAGQVDELQALLLQPEWLLAKVEAVGPHALIWDFELLAGDRDLEIVRAALRLALPALVGDSDQLCEQLLGRLPIGFSKRLDSFRRDLSRAAAPPRLHARWPNLIGPGEGLIQTLAHDAWVEGALLLPGGCVLSWTTEGTLRIWNLASGECRALKGHEDWVKGAVLLPDGRALSWSDDRTVRVWDLTTGDCRTLNGHEDWVTGALLLPDGCALSWSKDSTLRIWNLGTGESHVLEGHKEWVTGALLLPNGSALSWSEDGTLRIWDQATGDSQVFKGHEASVTGALPLPDGGALSWSADGTLRIWNLATGQSRVFKGHEQWVSGALLLPDERALSWGEDGTLRIWDLATTQGRTLKGHQGHVIGALLLRDGRALSWSEDGTVRTWDLTTGEGRTLVVHDAAVDGALLLSDGRTLSWSEDGGLRVSDLATGEGRALNGHEEWVTGALQAPDGRVLSWSNDRTLRVWDLAQSESGAFKGHKGLVHGAVLLPDRRALSWSDDRTLRIWDLMTGDSRALTGHGGSVTGTLLLPDGSALSWGKDGTLRIWNLASGVGRALIGHEGWINGVRLLSDGCALSWSADGTLRVWDLATGAHRGLKGHGGWVGGALLLADDHVLSWSVDGALRIWDLATGNSRVLGHHATPVHGALLLPDERAMSWSEDGVLRVWDLATGESRVLTGHEGRIVAALLLPDGRALSCSIDGTMRIWNLSAGEDRAQTIHEPSVVGALLLPDLRVLTWSVDGTMGVWDLATGERRALKGHDAWVHGVLLLADRRAVSWGEDRSIRIRDIDGDDQGLAFYFDATPTVVVPDEGGFLVGDFLGRIHYLELLAAR